jgi:hypothetical protein
VCDTRDRRARLTNVWFVIFSLVPLKTGKIGRRFENPISGFRGITRSPKLDHCFVGEWELNELWPEQDARQAKLRRFAGKHGLLLRSYEQGVGAVFARA